MFFSSKNGPVFNINGACQLTSNYTVFSQVPNGNFYNINGACKAIDVDTGREVGIKTWKTSASNRTFSIS